jgi:hypothetical protein
MAANYEAIMRDLNIVTAEQRCCFMLGVSAAEKAVEASQQPPTPAMPKLPPEEEIQNHIACAGIGLGPDLIDKRRAVVHLCYEYIRRQLRAGG